MSHVDEGALHAYLDGALDALPASEAARIRQHLASCEECARRLEEERALREDAGAILAGADPGVGAVPSLEELRQRAATRTRVGSGSRLRQLTWAASLVLAVGAGWLLRGSRDPRISEALDPLLREAAEERAVPAQASEQVGAPRPTADAAAAAGTADRGRAAESSVPAAVGGAAAVVPPPAEPMRAELADLVAAEESEAKVAAILGDSSAPRLVPSPAAPAGAPSMGVTSEARVRDVRGAVSQSLVSARESDQEAARRARGDLGPISVPGLPVLSIGTVGADLPAGTLRVLQLLDGDTLELLHLPAGIDPSTVAGPGDAGRTQVAVRYGAGWLLGRAHVSTEVLEALLARVTGGG